MAIALKIITSTTRAGRSADLVLPWLVDRLAADERFDVEVLDLRDWKLPLFQETVDTIGDRSDPTYSDPLVKAWNRKVGEGEAFVIVTAEYNHSVPGELKNALDNVFVSNAFRNKPVAFVGYSGGPIGGARAVEHLAHIMIEAEAVAAAQHRPRRRGRRGVRRRRPADQRGDGRRAQRAQGRRRVVGRRAQRGA